MRPAALWIALLGTAAACWSQTVSPTRAWYVSPSGSSSNTGAIDSPWDLVSALTTKCTNGTVQPGNTIWLRGNAGAYSPTARIDVTCQGTAPLPIRVRGYPGESVVIDADDVVQVFNVESVINLATASYVTVQDIRIFSSSNAPGSRSATASSTPPGRPQGIFIGPGTSVINVRAHDLGQSFGPSGDQAGDIRVYGVVAWNIAFHDSNDGGSGGQCFYTQNSQNWFRISSNICVNGGFNSLQIQGSSNASLSKIAAYNNKLLNGGAWRPDPGSRAGTNALIGGNGRNLGNIYEGNTSWTNNNGYTVGTGLAVFRRGWRWATYRDNYFVGRSASVEPSQNAGAGWAHFLTPPTGNTYIPAPTQQDFINNLAGNTSLSARPSSGKTFRYVQNIYEGIGGTVEVFNWDNSVTVAIDLAQLGFSSGDLYTVRDPQNYLGAPLATGTYSSGTINVSCNETVTAALIGPNPFTGAANPPVHTNNDTGRYCLYVVEPAQTTLTQTLHFTPQIQYPTVSRTVLQYGRTETPMRLIARPLHVTLLRNTLTVVGASTIANLDDPPCSIDPASGYTAICGSRDNGGVWLAPGSTLLITGISSGPWSGLSRAWTTETLDPGADYSHIAFNSDSAGKFATCLLGACAGVKALYNPVAPADIRYAGSIILNGDTLRTDASGTGDWTAVNNYSGTVTVPSEGHFSFTGPPLNLAPAGPNTATTAGTAFSSTAHGLAVNEYVWITSGAQNGQIRRVTAVPTANTATLQSSFPADITVGASWRRIASDFGAVDGTPPVARVNPNPLTFEVLDGNLLPGPTVPVTISGFTGAWTAANGVWTATVQPNGRFTIPVDSSRFGPPTGQNPIITAARWLDQPEQDVACSGGCSVTVPHYRGRMWYRWRYFNSAGVLLAESDRMPLTAN